MNITKKGHERRAMIARHAATPEGFSLRKTEGHPTKSCAKIVGDAFLAGEVCRVPTSSRFIWYFASREHARAFAGPHGVVEWHPLRIDSASVLAAKPKPKVKVANMATNPAFHIKRSGTATTFKPKPVAVVAQIVYTDRTRYSKSTMPERFAVTAPFLRIGQPEFSMSI